MSSSVESDLNILVESEKETKRLLAPSEKEVRKMYLAALAVLMFPVSMGMAAAYSATATENMKESSSLVKPTEDEISWIGSLLAIGALIGGPIAGYPCNKFGRRKCLMMSAVPFLTGWTLIACATNIWFIYVGRVLTGLCCGLICVAAPPYLVEIATPEVRGIFGLCFQLFACFGSFGVNLLGYFMNWKWQAVAAGVTAGIALCCIVPMPESPRWLVSKGKYELAIKSLIFLQGPTFDAASECSNIRKEISQQPRGSLNLKQLRDPCVYKAIIFSVGLMFFQQFCGSMVVLFFTAKIFAESGSALNPIESTLIVYAVLVVSTGVGCILVDKIGRRVLLMVSGIGMASSLVFLGACSYLKEKLPESTFSPYASVPLISVMGYIIFMAIGIGAIPWLMTAELSPSEFRDAIGGVVSFSCWSFVFIASKTFVYILAGIHAYGAYWLYAAFSFLQCLFAMLLPETKGRRFDEIQNYLRFGAFSPQIKCSHVNEAYEENKEICNSKLKRHSLVRLLSDMNK